MCSYILLIITPPSNNSALWENDKKKKRQKNEKSDCLKKAENLDMHLHIYLPIIRCLFPSLFIYSNVIETCSKGNTGIRCARRMSTLRHWGIRLFVSHVANLRCYTSYCLVITLNLLLMDQHIFPLRYFSLIILM